MEPTVDSHTLPRGDSVDAMTKLEQEEGKNLTRWLDLIQTAVGPLERAPDSIVDAYWSQGRRPDGRTFSEVRPYFIQHGALSPSRSEPFGGCSSSDFVGSAMVRTGGDRTSTIVLASVTTQVGQPAVTAPKQGDVLVSVVNCFNSSSGSSNSLALQTLQSFLQRILEENLDLEQLLLLEGKAAYRLVVNVSIIQDDSAVPFSVTMIDVCLAAVVAALLDTKLPAQPIIDDNGIVYAHASMYGVETKPFHMPIIPCSLTGIGVRLNRENDPRNSQYVWIVDPDPSEQQVPASCATIVVNAKCSSGSDSVLSVRFAPTAIHFLNSTKTHAIHPTASFGVTASELSQMIQLAVGHTQSSYSILSPSRR